MKKYPDEKNQLDKIEQRIIDLAHQQTLLLSLDNREIFKLLEKAEAENKTLTEQVRVLREALEFYANETNWDEDSFTYAMPVMEDSGGTARQALEAIKGESDEPC